MQLEITGIGQQKQTLKDWKAQNGIDTAKAPWEEKDLDLQWIATTANYEGYHDGYGETEKEAIWDLCRQQNIEPPFWW